MSMVEANKFFALQVKYLKAACFTIAAMSVVGCVLVDVAPLLTLEQLIFLDWYGKPTLPAEAVKPFRFAMLLFSWLSALMGAVLYYVVRYGIERRERWAYHCYLWLGIAWPVGAIAIGLITTAYWYLVSAGFMTIMFTPPAFFLRRFMKAE
jgi:hypothetical protein